ncbi:MAG TPA: hypothetical protein VFI40_08600 [Nocardioides sp.]|nr:hypothetical protein [Nocardioides sp.]
MLVSGRHAVRLLLVHGAATGEAQARALLRAGAAGIGTITDTGVFFDGDRVRELAERSSLDRQAQEASCPRGVYIARLSRATVLDLTRPWADVTRQVNRVPRMPTMTVALLEVHLRIAGRLPWVATLHGFVVHGAELVGFETDPDGVGRFRLEAPGEWFAAWRDRRLPGTPGGRPWVIRRPTVL